MINGWFGYDLSDLKRGCAPDEENHRHICLICGKAFGHGEVFPMGGRFFDAVHAAELHVQSEHGGVAAVLLDEDKSLTGLTDNQKELFRRLLNGFSDGEIARETGVKSATVRHTRFTLRERAKQAKLYLALYELVDAASKAKGKGRELVEVHEGAKMVDERYVVTREEEEKILKTCFESLEPMKLKVFSAREKKKIVTLRRITTLFEHGKSYTERQVIALLKPVFDDHATLRRYLIEYGFMERNADGSAYRLKERHDQA